MRRLVDGMNLIGSRPDGWWRDRPAAMRRLAADLDAYAQATGESVAVVFDGRPRSIEAAHVDVAFAPGGRDAADREIAARVAADPDPGSLTVVTSDRALADAVRTAGARVEGAGAFRAALERSSSEAEGNEASGR